MQLGKILQGVKILKKYNYKNIEIESITHISSEVIEDSIFICIKGNTFDGNDYIDEAIKQGAECIVTDKDICVDGIVVIVVKDVRMAMSIMAKNFYEKACDSLNIVGIIGTAGKTTTSHIIYQILSINDKNIGVIGTNGIYIGSTVLENKFTTPDPLELHYIFYRMKMLGVKTVIMEISAQAIYLQKMYGIKLKIGVYTNISPEHLDFFGSMENYARTKMNYFNKKNMNECVINIDDFYGMELAYKLNIPCVSFGINNPANSFALDISLGLDNLKFVANILDDVYKVETGFAGNYNIYNILAAMTVCKMLGEKYEDILQGILTLKPIDGRLNIWDVGKKKIIVDFAHTPMSVDKIVSFIRSCVEGKLVVVLGCVGYSDSEKRKDMTKSAISNSDYLIITTDNRGETDFDSIVRDMVSVCDEGRYEIVEDRTTAIKRGFEILQDGDTLVLLGKGAENFQKIGKERVPYSDIKVVEDIVNNFKEEK